VGNSSKHPPLEDVKEAVCECLDAFEGDAKTALEWLMRPVAALDNRAPIDCFSDQDDLHQLQAVIRKLEKGDFS